jgi:hypothetical protein
MALANITNNVLTDSGTTVESLVLASRTLTINGVTYDLTANRDWTLSTSNVGEGTNLYYTTARANTDFDTRLATKSTSNLSEGTNLYYTDARVGTYLTNNSYATQTYVNTAVSNLVDAAPGTLDTLNELAAALGDDPNFATTVATSIGTKEPIITAGITSQYWRGDKSWQTLPIYTLSGLGGQPQLNGTGFVKVSGTTVSYDNSTYYLASNPSGYITGISFANVSAKPTTIAGYGITDSLVYTTSTYSNPSWITALAWSKITGAPAFITGYTETDTLASVTGRGATTSSPIIVTASEGREVAVYMASSYTTDDLVSGHEYGWYNDHWRLGMTRSSAAPGADFVIQWNSARRLSLTNGGNLSVTGTISATNFSGSSSGTNTGDQTNISGLAGSETLSTVTGRGASTTNAITINRNVAGLVFNRDAVTNYNGIYYSTAGSPRWFIGMRENLSSNNHIHYSEQISQDILTLNVANGNATIYGNITIGNSAEVMGLIQMGASGRYGIGISSAFTNVHAHNSGNGVRLGSFDGTTFTPVLTAANGGTVTITGNVSAANLSGTNTGDQTLSGLGGLPLAGGTMTGQILGPSIGADAYGGLIQIRERGYVLAAQSAWSFSPAITFHWGDRAAIRFGLRADGLMAIDDVPLATRAWVTSQAYITGYTETDTLATVTARGASTASGITFTAPGGSILLKHAVSEVDAWIFQENAANWGLYWKNAPTGHHTFGGYTTVGAELFGMSAANSSGNGVTTTNFVGATSAIAQWMISNFTGYIWSASTIYAQTSMVVGGNIVYHAGNLPTIPTNTNQLTNGSGYITSATNVQGLYLQGLGNGSVNVSNGATAVYRNENGAGGNLSYAPVLHLGGGDTMWQIQGDYYSSTDLRWRAGYAGTWYAWRQIIHSANIGSQSVANANTVDSKSVGNGKGNIAYFDSVGNLYINNPETYTGEVRLGAAWARGGVYASSTLSMSTSSGNINFVSNDTTIGGFRWDSANGTRFIVGLDGNVSTPYTLVDTNKRPVIYARGLYPVLVLDHTETTNTNHGPTIQFAFNGLDQRQWVIGASGNGSRLDFGMSNTSYGNSNYNPHNGIGGYLGKTVMRITETGVAIGSLGTYPTINSPSRPLHVYGKSYFSDNIIIAPTSEGWAEGLSFTMPSTSTWGGLRWRRERGNNDGNWYVGFTALDATDDLVFGANNGGAQVDNIIRLTKAGNVSTSGSFTASGDVTAFSDARVKENIVTIDNALEKTLALRGVYYNRTDKDDKSQKVGVIAQEIQQVLPQVVQEQPDGMLGVSYGNMAGLFIEAIKEQQAQIESQKSEIDELKDLVKQLINR